MSNHFHLWLEVHRFLTARILQSLLTSYVRRFNKIHHTTVGDICLGLCPVGPAQGVDSAAEDCIYNVHWKA
jgi:hypothetical protein